MQIICRWVKSRLLPTDLGSVQYVMLLVFPLLSEGCFYRIIQAISIVQYMQVCTLFSLNISPVSLNVTLVSLL